MPALGAAMMAAMAAAGALEEEEEEEKEIGVDVAATGVTGCSVGARWCSARVTSIARQ